MKRFTTALFLLSFALALQLNAQPQFGQQWERHGPAIFQFQDVVIASCGCFNFVHFGHAVSDGQNHHLYYGKPSNDAYAVYRISSSDLTSGWTDNPGTPLITYSESWEKHIGSSKVIRGDDGTWRMWYAAQVDGSPGVIGYATSADGVAWTKHPQPVLEAVSSTWESGFVGMPEVLNVDGTYHLWYLGIDVSGRYWQIGHATSGDGVTWTRSSDAPAVANGSGFDSAFAMHPVVIHENGMFYMWYSGWNGGNPNVAGFQMRIGFATSPDGQNWTKDPSGQPVLTGVDWDKQAVSPVGIFKQDDGSYVMLYQGMGPGSFGLGVATLAATSTGVETEMPSQFSLAQNYPNPFNPSTTIDFALASAGSVRLAVYDMLGRQVRLLVDGFRSSGAHTAHLDASPLESGSYVYRLDTPAGSQSRVMHLLK